MYIDVKKRWTLGLVLLGFVVILWVISSFLISLIFESNSYRKPFLITYINTSSLVFYLIPTFKKIINNFKVYGCFDSRHKLGLEGEYEDQELSNEICDESENTLLLSKRRINIKLTFKDSIKLSGQFCFLWFLANLVTNASLSYTSVGSQTILSCTSSLFTLLIGSWFGVERINKLKILGSGISFIGIMLVMKSDMSSMILLKLKSYQVNKGIFIIFSGNILALSGAFLYGVYSTLLKWKVKNESYINMKIFFGFVGLFTLIFQWPIIILLHFIGWEKFSLPREPKIIFIIIINCIITFISDFCWAKAMLLTSPLTVTLGLTTTIPLTIFGDFLFRNGTLTILYLIGALLICISFFIINKDEEKEFLENTIIEETFIV